MIWVTSNRRLNNLRQSHLQSQVNCGTSEDRINASGCKSDWSTKSRCNGCFSVNCDVIGCEDCKK